MPPTKARKMTNSAKSDLGDMSIEDMMAADFDSGDDGDDDEEENEVKLGSKGAKSKLGSKGTKAKLGSKGTKAKLGSKGAKLKSDVNETNSGKPTHITKHKQALDKLKETDPEFFEFLRENEEGLLDFDESDDSDIADDDDDEDDVEDEGTDDEGGMEDDSDEHEMGTNEPERGSDEEDSAGKDGKRTRKMEGIQVTLSLIEKWKEQLENDSVKALRELMKAFRAAVQQAGSGEDTWAKYIVEDSMVFNAVVSLSLRQVYPVLQRTLGLEDIAGKRPRSPTSSPKWKQLHVDVKAYLTDLLQLMSNVAESSIVSVVLRHVRSLIPYFTCFPKLVKAIIKKLVNLWSTGEETVRVLAFLCLFSIVRCTKEGRLDYILKQMYLAYVRNTKFTSPSTLPVINFMQRSLTEMFALNTQVTYQHAFVYIRQLAIHLRNAITVKKKDMYQSVYNWQYIHCIYLWCRVLATLHSDEILKPLLYPLVQTSVGVIKLIPAARYFPLRFHVIRALNLLSEATDVFIPLLPFILEVLQMTDFNKKHAISSFKPLNFAVMLRLSNSQLKERAFKDGIIDQVYDLLVEHLQIYSHQIGFPELALPVVLELKSFGKKCKVANFTKQMKQLLDKVLENCQEVTKRREKVSFGLADNKALGAWEAKNREQGTTITKFYQTYKKLRERELKHEEAGKDRLIDDKIPTITQGKKRKLQSKMELKGLFKKDVGSDDEEDLFKRVERKQKRLQENKKKPRHDGDDDDDDDDLEDLDEDDFADLSDDDSDEDDFDSKEDEGTLPSKAKRTSTQKAKKTEQMDVSLKDVEDKGDVVEDFQMWSDDEDDDGKAKVSGKSKKNANASRAQQKGRGKGKKASKPQMNGSAGGKKKKKGHKK